ncbi:MULTISPECIES: PrsW family intramembrane metalloprotease [Aphanothece]|uniref:PrsW family intramembrane metalloprotease n=1 Tax=Aphanothece TaxID=1121 RepID=UPI0039853D45
MSITAANRFLCGSPLANPRIARFVAIVLALLLEASVIVLVKFNLMSLEASALGVFIRGLLMSTALSSLLLLALWFLDRRERESIWLYAVMFLWGALIATAVASPLDALLSSKAAHLQLLHAGVLKKLSENSGQIFPLLFLAPAIQELIKGIGVFVAFVMLKSEFDGVRDGFVYGALVGIGFNLVDSSFYLANAYAQTGVASWWQYFVTHHALLGFGGQALYTGLFGMGLGLARQTTRPWLRVVAPVTGWFAGLLANILGTLMGWLTIFLAVSMAAQGLVPPFSPGDPLVSSSSFWALLISGSYLSFFWSFPFVALAGLMLWQSGEWERGVIRGELADELDPVITPAEYQAVLADRMLRTRRIPAVSRSLSAGIVNAQNELALRKWRLRHDGKPLEGDPLLVSWREELARLRGRA